MLWILTLCLPMVEAEKPEQLLIRCGFPSNKITTPSHSQSDSHSACLTADWQGECPGKLKRQTVFPLMENQPAKCHFYLPQNCPVRNMWLLRVFSCMKEICFPFSSFQGLSPKKEPSITERASTQLSTKFSKFTHSRIPSRLPRLGQSV